MRKFVIVFVAIFATKAQTQLRKIFFLFLISKHFCVNLKFYKKNFKTFI